MILLTYAGKENERDSVFLTSISGLLSFGQAYCLFKHCCGCFLNMVEINIFLFFMIYLFAGYIIF